MIINWNNTETLLLNVTDFSVSNDLFKEGIHVSLDFLKDNVDIKTSKFIERWRTNNDIKTIIINKETDYFLLEKGYPKMVYIDNTSSSFISSGDFSFKSYKNISRAYKISKILNN
jgi:hypothetical protein